MKTIYSKVQCSDRLPEKSGEYLTDVGNLTYNDEHGEFGYDSEDLFGIENRYWQNVNCAYWLEEIQVPTEETIVAIMNEARYEQHIHPKGNTIYPHLAGYNFNKVAKAILRSLKSQ